MTASRYRSLLQEFRTWATGESAVRAAIVVGSQARVTEPADEWSDLDVVIFHEHPEQLLGSTDWVERFGPVLLTVVEPTAVFESRERRVLYRDGRDVDFAVFPARALAGLAQHPEGLAVLGRGYEVLADKDGQLPRRIPGAEAHVRDRRPPPEEPQFQSDVRDFWYHVLWTARKLRRGELWAAKFGCDGYLKRLLLRMVEWQVVVQSGRATDVWHEGRFLDRWAPAEVRTRLPATFARYDRADLARGLRATAELYSEVAREVARRLSWEYPEAIEAGVLTLVRGTLPESGASP